MTRPGNIINKKITPNLYKENESKPKSIIIRKKNNYKMNNYKMNNYRMKNNLKKKYIDIFIFKNI